MRSGALALILAGCTTVSAMPVPREDVAPTIPESTAVDDQGEAPVLAPPPPPRTCREELAAAGVRFEDASPSPTIVDAVKLAPQLGGVEFRHERDKRARWLWVDCRFALRLHRAAGVLRERGVRSVVHVGTYEPKCANAGPGCAPSTHALGMAIDVVALVREHDTVSIERDFVRRASDKIETCRAPRVGERDAFLKSLVCDLDGTFSVLLTPNWDEKHRTHFHFELRPPTKAPWSNGVDPARATD